MQKKLLIFLLSLASIFSAIDINGQREVRYFLGSGFSISGFGDVVTLNIQNAVDLSLNKYFTAEASHIYGQGINRWNSPVYNLNQANLNLLFSPLRKRYVFDFKIGTGFSYYYVNRARISSQTYINGVLVEQLYEIREDQAWGVNIILDGTVALGPKFYLGLRLFTRPYSDYEINSGYQLRVGIKL